MPAGASFTLPAAAERAAYVASGSVLLEGRTLSDGTMAVARPGATVTLESTAGARVLVIGGEPLGSRHIWWNFVPGTKSGSGARSWTGARAGSARPDDEFIPLPRR